MRGPQHLGKVLVLGLGKSGKSAARYCAALLGTRVDRLFVAAGAENDDSRAFVESLAESIPSCHPERSAKRGVEGSPHSAAFAYAFGDDALEGDVGAFDLCIASPGIPFWHELYVRGAGLSAEIISEVEFAWRESAEDSTWVAITGTNGKTTTTSLAAHVLRECGYAANAVGNIGEVCLDAVAAGDTQVYVAEVSSYQLHSTRLFAPDVAVMLNITPDHIHWHQTFEAYRDAKFKMLDNIMHAGRARGERVLAGHAEAPAQRTGEAAAELACSAGSNSPRSRFALIASQPQKDPQEPVPHGRCIAILDAANDVVRAKVRELKAMTREQRGFDYLPMGTADGMRGDMRAKCGAENAAFLGADGVLHVALGGVEHLVGAASDLQIQGEHNVGNALAAAAVAVALGADDGRIAQALASFTPLAHRIEPCGTVAGVVCYNDSKATNVDATCKALQAFPGKRVVVMLGGDDKGTDLSELVAATHEHAACAVCYGEGGPRFADALLGQNASGDACPIRVVRASHMEDAFDAALAHARPGDVVLLSPACASFDEFRSFEHRGDVFKQLVADRAARQGA